MDRVTILKQEIFNEVYAKAQAQQFLPSYMADEEGTCAYRGSGAHEGMCCNVGHLIPQERYKANMEGTDMSNEDIFPATTAYDRCVERGFDGEDQSEIKTFLEALQWAHDQCGASPAPAPAHRAMLHSLAEEESLVVPQLAEAA